jgi:hypothetical protein
MPSYCTARGIGVKVPILRMRMAGLDRYEGLFGEGWNQPVDSSSVLTTAAFPMGRSAIEEALPIPSGTLPPLSEESPYGMHHRTCLTRDQRIVIDLRGAYYDTELQCLVRPSLGLPGVGERIVPMKADDGGRITTTFESTTTWDTVTIVPTSLDGAVIDDEHHSEDEEGDEDPDED